MANLLRLPPFRKANGVAIAAQVAAQLATPQPTVTTPVATQPKPVTQSTESSASTKQPEAEPVSNNEILPEAVASVPEEWRWLLFCDGPIQMTSVGEQGEEGLAKVRATRVAAHREARRERRVMAGPSICVAMVWIPMTGTWSPSVIWCCRD